MRRQRASRWVVAVLACSALLAAACGDDAAGSDSAGARRGGGRADLSISQANVDAKLRDPQTVGVTEPLPEPPPGDGSIIWLECPVPECVAFGDGVQAGAEALGWDFSRIGFDLTPESAQAAFEQALRERPDAIMATSIDPSWITQQREAAIDRGVGFFDCCSLYEEDPDNATGGFGGVEAPPAGLIEGPDHVNFQGAVMADYAIVETEGEVNALTVYIPDFPIGIVAASAFDARLQEICPDTCTSSPLEIAVEDIGTNVPSMIVSELQRDPGINFVMFISGSFAIGLDAALMEAGLQDQVQLVGNNPIPSNFESMLAGDVDQAWLGLSSEVVGWRYVDMAVRHKMGIEIPEVGSGVDETGPTAWAPDQLLTRDNYQTTDPFNRPDNHPELFRELWLLADDGQAEGEDA